MIEAEIKFTVAQPEVVHEIVACRGIAGYTVKDRGIRRHTDTYFDTPDRRLLRAGMVLRLREQGGCAVLTFKVRDDATSPGAPGNDPVHRRIELEQQVSDPGAVLGGAIPGGPALDALRSRMGDVRLAPGLAAVNDRHTLLLSRGGNPEFELVLDDVRFTGPGGTAQVLELEVEGIGGSHKALRAIAAWLARRFDLTPAGPSKYILGMELVGLPSPS